LEFMEDDSVSERADQQNRTRTAAVARQMPLATRQQAIFYAQWGKVRRECSIVCYKLHSKGMKKPAGPCSRSGFLVGLHRKGAAHHFTLMFQART
jgi:hypothetical protein